MPDRLACDRAMNLSKVRLRVYDPDLKNGEVMKTQVGPSWSPWGLQGGFAVVYKFRTYSGKIRALRCYLTPMKPDIQYRYERIGAYFARHIPDITAEFKYHNDGILIDEQGPGTLPTKKAYSLIEMEWIEGTTLPEYVAGLCQQRDQAGLGDIVDQWVAIIKALRNAQIAHCDLAGGNIMVRQDGCLVLVDYDGVYIPDFAGMAGVVDGQADYQHPDVAQRPFNEQADTFSFMVIYAALLALHLQPELWQKYVQQDSLNKTLDTNLLFKKQDFLDPSGSPLLSELETINDTRLSAVVRDLKQACRQPVTQVQLSPYIGDPEKEALDKLEQAIQQDDDEEIVRAWESTLLDTYEPAQKHRARFVQAQDMVRKIEDFRDAVQTGLMQQMIDRYDFALDHCKNIKPEERDLLRLARKFREAYHNDDDDVLNAVWDEILILNYSTSFHLTWQETQRRDLAQQRQEAFTAFQKALAAKKAQSIVDAYDPVLDSSPRIGAEERDTLDLAEEFIRAYRSDDDESIIEASERIQQSSLSWRITFTVDERQRITLARLRLAVLEAFRQALLKKNIEGIVGAYDPVLDTVSTVTFEERQLLQAAQRFVAAYEQHDDQGIVTSSAVIAQSYQQSLHFTPEQVQRIEQARLRMAMLEKLRQALASKSIEKIVAAYHPIMEVSKSVSSDERKLLTWALDLTQGYNDDDDEAIVGTWHAIQNSSHRYAFTLTLTEEQRLSLAQQRVTVLNHFRSVVQTSSREAEKIISAYDAVLDDCANVTPEERNLLQAAHYYMSMYKAVLEGIQNDNDQQIYSMYDEMIARQFADFTRPQQERINRALKFGQLEQTLQNNNYGSAIRLAQEIEMEVRKQIIDFRLTLARKRFIKQFEVKDIEAWRVNDEVVARWSWPADNLVRYAVIVWRTDRWPQGPQKAEPGTGRVTVLREQAENRLTRFKADLYMAVYLQVYFAIPDLTQQPPTWFYSDGIDPGSKTEAYYSGPASKVI